MARASPAVWENPIITSAKAATRTVPAWSTSRPGSGTSNDGRPLGMSPDQGDVPGLEVQHPRGDESAHEEHECSGDLRGDPPETEDDDERHDPDHRRGGVRLVQRGQPGPELLERVAALAVGAGQLGQLPDDDVDRCAEEESGDDGTGEELRQPPHPEHGEGQEEQSGRQRDPGHQGGHVGGIGQAGRQDRAAGDGGEPRAGAHRDLAAAAEQGVEDRPGGGGIETVLEGHAGDLRVPEVLGDDQRRHHDAGDEVTTQPGPLVVAQLSGDRQDPEDRPPCGCR